MSLTRLKQLAQDGASNGDVIAWNGTTWAPTTLTSATVGAAGAIQFSDGSSGHDSDTLLTWNDTNKTLGIGDSPTSTIRMMVTGQSSALGNAAFHFKTAPSNTSGRGTIGYFSRITTGASISDTFGTDISFIIGDSGGSNTVGGFGVLREGVDNEARLVWYTTPGGVWTEKATLTVDGNFGVGANATTPGGLIDAHTDQNANTIVYCTNSTSGTTAAAQIRTKSNGNELIMSSQSTGFSGTTDGIALADAAQIASTGATSLWLRTIDSAPIYIMTNSLIRATFLAAGGVGFGADATSPASDVEIRVNQNDITDLIIRNTTDGTAAMAGMALFTDTTGGRVFFRAYATSFSGNILGVSAAGKVSLVSDIGTGMVIGTSISGDPLQLGAGNVVAITVNGTTQRVSFASQICQDAVDTSTPTGTTQTIDWDNGNFQILDLESATGNVTVTLSNGQPGGRYSIKVIQDSVTARTVTFTGVRWAGGTAPTLTTTLDGEDVYEFWYDGTNYYGSVFGQDFS